MTQEQLVPFLPWRRVLIRTVAEVVPSRLMPAPRWLESPGATQPTGWHELMGLPPREQMRK